MKARTTLVKAPVARHGYRGDGIHDEEGYDRCTHCGLPQRNRVHAEVAR